MVHQLDRNSEKALYMQLAERLMDDIAAKRLLPLEKIPSEYELTQHFEVSRITVRQAIRVLVDRGLVVSRQGKGVFVSGPEVSQDLNALRGFYDSLIARGYDPETEVVAFNRHDSSSPEAADMDGEAVSFVRIYRVEDAVVAIAEATVACFGQAISRQAIEKYPVYLLLQDVVQRRVGRATVSIQTAHASTQIAEWLSLGGDAMALRMDRTSYDESGTVLERTRFHIQPEIFAFDLTVSGPMQIASSLRKVK